MKVFLLLLVLVSSILSNTINGSLLNIHATIVPKLTLMDYKFEQKLENNSITIIIYYDKINYNSAKKLQDKIDSKYSDGLKGYPIETKLVLYTNTDSLSASIYYLFPSNKKNIKKTVAKATKNNAITFSYSLDDLSNGCMISLDIGKKVKPIINLNAIKNNDISIRPVLIDISNIYTLTQKQDNISSVFNISIMV